MNEDRDRVRVATLEEALDAIRSEREYQDSRWNASTTTSKGLHSLTEWFAYIEDYVREAQHVLARTARQDAYSRVIGNMRKIAAMATAAMEEHGAPRR